MQAKKQRDAAASEWAPVKFLRETWEELRKVVWPSPPELYRYTVVVIITVVVLAAFIGFIDFGVSRAVARFIYTGGGH